MASFTKSITIQASRTEVWTVLSDIGIIAQWNPSVVKSRTTSTEEVGLGASRRCELGGKNYLDEDVVEWEPEKTLTMRIIATNLPFKRADIRFSLEERGRDTVVLVSPDYELKFGVLGHILDLCIVRRQYQKGMKDLLLGLKQFVENTKRS